jgi:hypothetical protein
MDVFVANPNALSQARENAPFTIGEYGVSNFAILPFSLINSSLGPMGPLNASVMSYRRTLLFCCLAGGFSTLLWGHVAETDWMDHIQSKVAALPSITITGWTDVDDSSFVVKPVGANLDSVW